MTEDTELLREIRDLLLEGVKLKRAQLNALRVPLGLGAEQPARGAHDKVVTQKDIKKGSALWCERCNRYLMHSKPHIHTVIP